MPDKQAELNLLAKVDQRTIAQSSKAAQKLADDFDALSDAELKAAQNLGPLNEQVRKNVAAVRQHAAAAQLSVQAMIDHARGSEKAQASLKELNAERQKSVRSIRAETDALYDELDALRQTDNASAGRSSGAGSGGMDRGEALGRVERGSAALAQVAGIAGSGPVGESLRAVADIAGALEQLPSLAEGFNVLITGSSAAKTAQLQLAAAESSAGSAAAGATPGMLSMLAAVAPLALVAAVAGAGLLLFNKAVQEGKEAIVPTIALEKELAEIRANGSKQQTEAALESARLQDAILREQIASLRERGRELAQAELGKIAEGGSIAALGTGESLGRIKGLQAELEGLDNELAINQDRIAELSRILERNSTAAADAARAQAELTSLTLASLQANQRLALQAQEIGATGNSDQLKARLEAIEREKQAIADQIAILKPLAVHNEAYRIELQKQREQYSLLTRETQLLTEVSEPLIRAREREADATERLKAAQEKFDEHAARQVEQAQAVVRLRDEFLEATKAAETKLAADRISIVEQTAKTIADIESKLVGTLDRLNAEASQADSAAITKLDRDIEAINQAANDREVELRIEAQARVEDLLERHAQEVERIYRNLHRDELNAIQNRDAVALDAARSTASDQLKEANTQLKTGVKQEQTALKQRLEAAKRADDQRIRDLRNAFDQERRDRQAALQQRIVDAQNAAVMEINVARERGAQQLIELQTRFDEEMRRLKAHTIAQFETYDIHFKSIESLTETALDTLAESWSRFLGDMNSALAASNPSTGGMLVSHEPPPEPLASGTRSAKGGWAKVGENGQELVRLARGSEVFNHRDTMKIMRGAGGMTFEAGAFQFNIDGQGGDARAIMREIERKFPKLLERTLRKELASG